MKKLSHRWQGVALPLILSIMMTTIISGVSTAKALGLGPGFASAWLIAFGVSWIVAFPTLLIVLPLVRRIVSLIVAPPP
jgi:Protein of unknown function (DUF2798)